MAEDGAPTEVEIAPDASGAQPRRPWVIVGIAVAVVVVLLVAAVAIKRGGSSSKTPAATLEPAGEAGESPFTDSVAVGEATTFPEPVQTIVAQLRDKLPTSKQTQTLVVTGTAPGVFAGNGPTLVCNAQALIDYLRKNPGNAAAWSKASGVPTRSISNFVKALTPVLVTMDTRVTNNGYDNATVAPRQSILEAGTAVMVDTTGLPRVVCDSGNPLTATRPIAITKTRGDAWDDFDPKTVTTIKAGAAAKAFTLINATTGKYYQQPAGVPAAVGVGGVGGAGGQWVVARPDFTGSTLQSTTILEIGAAQPWKEAAVIPKEAVIGVAWGDGKWVAVTSATNGGAGNHVLVSTDLRTWKQTAALPNRLSAIAYGNGRWTATSSHFAPVLGTTDSRTEHVIYSSTDALHWQQVAVVGVTNNSPGPPGQGPLALAPVAYADGEWLTAAASGNIPAGNPVPPLTIFSSKDGVHWKPNGIQFRGQIGTSLTYGDGRWALAAVSLISGRAVLYTSANGTDWVASTTNLPPGGIPLIASGNDEWTAALVSPFEFARISIFVTSADAKTWKPLSTVPNWVSAIAYGGAKSAGPSGGSSGSTTTTAPTTVSTASSAPTPQ